MRSTGLVLAAGGIAAANELVFAPIALGKADSDPLHGFNWRLIPATAILALALGGLETVSPPFAKGLAGLVLLSVLVIPIGNAPDPLTNIAASVTGKTK